MLVSLFAYMAVFAFISRESIPLPGLTYYAASCGYGLLFWLPYIADRLIGARFKGFLYTLIFPLAYTSWEYVFTSINPFFTTGSTAYTQYGNLPLMQMVSVTGMWGIVFIMAWFASVVNWAWDRSFVLPEIRSGVGLYAGILALVLLSGGTRLAVFHPDSTTVRASSLVATPEIEALLEGTNWDDKWNDQTIRDDTPIDEAKLVFSKVLDKYLELSRQEAQSGSKLLLWQEGAAFAFEEDERSFIERGRKLADEENIYLFMPIMIMTGDFFKVPGRNKLIGIDPSGNIVCEYTKTFPVPGEPVISGDGLIPVINTPYGKIAAAICFDFDNPAHIRQAGKAGADIMLNPSYDYKGITPFHTYQNAFRAVENGVSIMRCTGQGFSAAYDYQGRVLSARNYFENNSGALVSYLPVKGTRTVNSIIGDLFVWLCIVAFLSISILGFAGRKRRKYEAANQSEGDSAAFLLSGKV